MGSFSEHFDKSEFVCPCCSTTGNNGISTLLINRLEKLHKELNCTSIKVTSGFRCPDYSVSVGGYKNDAHTIGIAADIVCFAPNNTDESLTTTYYDGKKVYKSDVVAEKAEIIGFGGIGIIDDTATHVDTRDSEQYVNSHWFGDERTNKNVTTFYKGLTKKINARKTKVIELIIDGETIFKSEVSE